MSPKMMRRVLVATAWALSAAVGMLQVPLARAELPSVKLLTAPLVTPSNAWTYYNSLPATTATPTRGVAAWSSRPPEIQELARALGSTRIPGTFTQAQYATNVYEYVRNNIAIEFRFGLSKGARGALIDQSGTAFDQAHLMVELLRQAGIAASYKVGEISVPAAQFTAWTGISNARAACQFLADGGIPATVNGETSSCANLGSSTAVSSVTMGHAWVQALSTTYDPAYKVHIAKAGIDLAAAMGCGTAANATCGSSLLSTALVPAITQSCGISGVNCVTNVDQNGIETQLKAYATSLMTYIKNYNNSNATYLSMEDVVGGFLIDTNQRVDTGSLLPAASYPATAAYTWTGDIPDSFRTRLTVTLDAINQLLFADEIAGNRVKIWGTAVRNSSSDLRATRMLTLYSEGRPLVQSVLTNQVGALTSLGMLVTHPYAANTGGYASDTLSFPVKIQSEDCETTLGAPCSGVWHVGVVTIMNGWGEQTQSTVTHYGDLQQRDKVNGYPWEGVSPTLDPRHIFMNFTAKGGGCLQTTIVVEPSDHNTCYEQQQGSVSASWLAEAARARVLAGSVNGVALQHHHSLGIVFSGLSLESNETIFNVQSALSGQSRTAVASDRTAAFTSATSVMNRLEGGVEEQAFGAWEGGAAVSMMVRANTNHVPFLEVNSGNAAAVLAALGPSGSSSNYWQADLSAISDYATDPVNQFSLIVPKNGYAGDFPFPNGTLSYGSTGIAAFGVNNDRIAYLATLGPTLVKGTGGAPTDDPANQAQQSTKVSDYAVKSRKGYGVDLSSGELQLTAKPDLVTGIGDFPLSLAYQRVYSSSRLGVTHTEWSNAIYAYPSQPDPAAIGGGWTHTLAITAQIQSDAFAGMGRDGALPASSVITGMFVQRWLQKGTVDLRSRLANVFATHWLASGLNRNAVSVSRPPTRSQFTLLPDGTFDAGPGSAERLTQNGVQTMIGMAGTSWWWYAATMNFSLLDKNGSTMTFQQKLPTGDAIYLSYPFDWPFVATSWTFPNGVALTFTYKTDGATAGFNRACLTKVENNLGRYFTFNDPCGATATSGNPPGAQWVQDDAGRRVTFSSLPAPIAPGNWLSGNEQGTTSFMVTGPDGGVTRYDYSWTPAGSVVRPYGGISQWFTPSDSANPYVKATYDSLFRVSALTDNSLPNAFTTQYFIGGMYGTQNQKRADVVDSLTAMTTSYFDQWGHAIQTIDPLLRVTSYAYDAHRRLTKKTYPELDSERYTFDARSNQLTVTHKPKPGSALASQVTTTAYVEGPTVLTCSNPSTCNKPSTVDGPRTDVTDVTTYSYNSNGTVARIVGPSVSWQGSGGSTGTSGSQADFCYGSFAGTTGSISLLTGRIAKVGSTNRVASYSYNSLANHLTLLNAIVDPTTTLVPPATAGSACTTAQKTGGVALTSSFAFDSVGNVTAVDGPIAGTGDTTNYSFDAARRLTRIQSPAITVNGVSMRPITRYSFDLDGQLLTSRHSVVASPTDSNPSTGQPTDLVASDWQTETRAYWPTGDLKSVQDPEGNLTQHSYDAVGREILATDPDGRRTSEVYDLAGQALCTWWGWDVASAATDCSWNPSAYTGSGKVRYAAYTYTSNGKHKSVQDANNNVTQYGYDYLDRQQYTAFPDPNGGAGCTLPAVETGLPSCSGSQTYEQAGYDSASNRTSLRTRKGDVLTFAFDASDRMVSKTVPGLPVVSYGFNLLGEPMSASNPALGVYPAHSTTYDYDDADRKLFENNDNRVVSYQFDNAGNRTRVTWPDSYFAAYQFDLLNRMQYAWENSTSTNELAYYDYDILSRRLHACLGGQSAACIAGNGTNKATYAYESDNDLQSLVHTLNTASLSFGYGRNHSHQVTSLNASDSFYLPTANTAENVAYVPNNLNQYGTVAGVTVAYDLNGNLTNWNVPGNGSAQSYTYDAENRLRTVIVTGTGAATASYDYDSLGRRVGKTVGSVTTNYLLEGDEEIAEYAGTTLLRRYISESAIDERIARAEGSSISNPSKTFYHTNPQGSVIALTDASGTVSQRLAYDEFGNLSSGSDPIGEPYRYTGRRYDPETGLYYYRARYYAPQIGRFLQADPIGYKDDFNLYAYVGNDPLDGVDPTGTLCVWGVNSWDDFCQRSYRYEKVNADRSVASRTSFFGAAAIVTSALGGWPQSDFMRRLSASLEKANMTRANQIRAGKLYSGGTVRENTADFVHFEQGLVQTALDKFQRDDPDRYVAEIQSASSMLNGPFGRLARATDPTFARAAAATRKALGRDIDFGSQSDREALGNAVAEQIEQSDSGGSDACRRDPACKTVIFPY